ncbi:MAG: HAMP domain-containing histidine kinase [Anaerolineales bacterium]|nr:HAMP domain-containing histidine kinase [Anaerolineales bacterium]
MNIQRLIQKIRASWIQRVSHTLARDISVREAFEIQLNRFYDLLEQAIQTGDPAVLDSVLLDWANSPTLSQFEQVEKNVSKALNEMSAMMQVVAREMLTKTEALDLIMTLAPLYMYALEKVARFEAETRVVHVTHELAGIQQKLEKLDKTKSNFISVAAHELKTPLTLIEGYTSMMSDVVMEANNGGIDPLLQGVNTGIRRLRQIVDDMIDVSLIDNHMLSLNFQPVRISYTIGLLKAELKEVLDSREQTIEMPDFPENESWMYADNERIYQALQNVLTNAIKYTPNKGRIIVRGRILPGFIEITVADTGIGISPENQALIFEKFGQLGRVDLHSSGKTKFKGGGPGLGLPITRGIIEAHGGSIWVESEGYDEKQCPGCTFHILLPTRTEANDERIAKLLGSMEKMKETYGKENTSPNQTSA